MSAWLQASKTPDLDTYFRGKKGECRKCSNDWEGAVVGLVFHNEADSLQQLIIVHVFKVGLGRADIVVDLVGDIGSSVVIVIQCTEAGFIFGGKLLIIIDKIELAKFVDSVSGISSCGNLHWGSLYLIIEAAGTRGSCSKGYLSLAFCHFVLAKKELAI